MGPSDAVAAGAGLPLYPFNGSLLGRRTEDLFGNSAPSGSLWSPVPRADPQSTVASLFANVAPGLLTRDRLAEVVADLPELVRIAPSANLDAEYPAYRIALEYLMAVPLEGSTVPWLNRLVPTAVEAELIGELMVLTLPDRRTSATRS